MTKEPMLSQWQCKCVWVLRRKVNTSAVEPSRIVATGWSVSALTGRAVSISQQLGTHPVTRRAGLLITRSPVLPYRLYTGCVPLVMLSISTHFKLELCKFAYDEPRVSVSAKRGAIPIQVHVGFILASWLPFLHIVLEKTMLCRYTRWLCWQIENSRPTASEQV